MYPISENISLSCRVWRFWHYNISKGFREELLIEEHKYDSLLWTSVLITSLFGNLLLGVICHFERFGGDSKKRSLQNRLASQIAFSSMLIMNSRNFFLLNLSYRFASYEILMLYIKLHRAIYFINLDLITLHTLVVYLQVVVWKRLKEFNEELIIRAVWITLYLGNTTLSFLCPLQEKMDLYFYLIGGNKQPTESYVAENLPIVSR